jgi:L-2-hydroxyglutarate oxidase LhgO
MGMDYEADIIIVGAGVIGLAISSEVAKEGREVYILEKNETFGKETSSRNSEVIHTSTSYPKGSLNAKLCMEGNRLLYELCQKYSIGYRKIGKLTVAVENGEIEALEALFEKGKAEGIDLRMLSQRELKKKEPNIRGVAAIFSPETGIIDSYGLMKYFLGKAKDNGAQIAYKTEVIAIDQVSGRYKVEVKEPGGNFLVTTRVVINCAGFQSDKIAAMVGIDTVKAGYKLHYCKGEYYSLSRSKSKMVNHLVYPTPRTGHFPGIHTCVDVWGRTRLGPAFYYVDDISYRIDNSRKQLFYDSSRRLFPFIEPDDIEPESAGIMPRLYGEGETFKEFIIRDEYDKGLPGFINLIGIESPGLTCSPVIAKYVSHSVDEALEDEALES